MQDKLINNDSQLSWIFLYIDKKGFCNSFVERHALQILSDANLQVDTAARCNKRFVRFVLRITYKKYIFSANSFRFIVETVAQKIELVFRPEFLACTSLSILTEVILEIFPKVSVKLVIFSQSLGKTESKSTFIFHSSQNFAAWNIKKDSNNRSSGRSISSKCKKFLKPVIAKSSVVSWNRRKFRTWLYCSLNTEYNPFLLRWDSFCKTKIALLDRA